MTKPALLFTVLATATLGAQLAHYALLEHELRSAQPALMPAELCRKCDDHISGTSPEGMHVNYQLPADYLSAHSAWFLRHRDSHPNILELHYTISYLPRPHKPVYQLGVRVNGIPLPEATRLMQRDAFPLPDSAPPHAE